MIKKYFDIKYYWKNDKPIITLKLKKNLMLNKENKSIKELNGNSKEYYIFHYGKVLGNELRNEYKKISTIHARIKWYVENFNLSTDEKKKLLLYRDEYLKRIKESNIKKYSNPDFKSSFNIKMKNPKRVDIIRRKAKEMWIRAKTIDHELYRRMTTSCYVKKYELNGIKMNSIEYLIGNVLNELNYVWEYEKIFNFEKDTFLPDFFIKDKNMIIECYGDYWHANPKIFKNTDKIYRNGKFKILAENIWRKDKYRKNIFEKNGYTYFYFWEDDVKNNIEKIKGELKNE